MASEDKKYEGKVASTRHRDKKEDQRLKRAAGEAGTTAVDEDVDTPGDGLEEVEKKDDNCEDLTTRGISQKKKSKTITLIFPRNIMKSPKICPMADHLACHRIRFVPPP